MVVAAIAWAAVPIPLLRNIKEANIKFTSWGHLEMRLVFEKEKEKGCARDEQVHNLNYPLQGTIRITWE